MSGDDKAKVLEETYNGLRRTHSRQMELHREINQRAIDLVKIDLLAASFVATAISFSEFRQSVFLTACSLFALIIAISSCALVYKPRKLPLGISGEAGGSVRDMINSGDGAVQFYNKLVYQFGEFIRETENTYDQEVRFFLDGLWASIASVLFFSASLYPLVSPGPSWGSDVVLALLITILSVGVNTISHQERMPADDR